MDFIPTLLRLAESFVWEFYPEKEGLKRVDRPDDKRVIEQVREKLGRSAKICT